MPRYKLRTLLILLAILPPLLWVGWTKHEAWRAERERLEALSRLKRLEPIIAIQRPRHGRLALPEEPLHLDEVDARKLTRRGAPVNVGP
jgi:hypothetical protein